MTATDGQTDSLAGVACSFCLKPTEAVATMVAGPGVFICNECVVLCQEIIDGKPDVPPAPDEWKQQLSDEDLLALLPKIAAAGEQVDRHLTGWVRR
ncbi:MAG: ClpX C4-type zinc finger protein, partial [Actinomycetota bacterium]